MDLDVEKKTEGEIWHRLLREVFLLKKAIDNATEEVHKATGLTTSQRQILRRLILKGKATVPDIARERKVSRQSSQIMINDMLKDEMVQMEPNPRHKSSSLVVVTEKGRTQFREARRKEDSILEKKLSRVPPEGVLETTELLHKIREAIGEELF